MTLRSLTSKILLILYGGIVAACGSGGNHSSVKAWNQSPPYDWYQNLSIESFDGTRLEAQLMVPKADRFPGPRPAIIFANSWALNHYQYTVPATDFAKKGYIVLSYSTRGFGRSEGVVTAAGPNDIRDVSNLLDWLEKNAPVHPQKIGMAGISYGGGIGLLALAHEPRITTTVAMSGWADMEKSLYGDSTIRKVWIELLLGSGAITGRLDPSVAELYRNVRIDRELEYFYDWTKERSVVNLVDLINERKAPVFIANSFDDHLFPPNQMHEFFNALTGPKKFSLNQGIHATTELAGLIGQPSRQWDDVHRWFDYWLLGEDTGIGSEEPISMDYRGQLEFFAALPTMRDALDLPLTPQNDLLPHDGSGPIGIRLDLRRDSGATTGIPVLAAALDSYTPLDIVKKMYRIREQNGAVLYSERLQNQISLRGVPKVEAWILPASTKSQLVAYLYDVDRAGWGKLVTHGVISLREYNPGEPLRVEFNLNTLAADIEEGHQIALVIDGYDMLYEPATHSDHGITLVHEREQKTRLFLPVDP